MKNTKELILETAYKMFLCNSYEGVTISRIIKATGLTKGAIYHYYSNKEHLFKAVVDKYMLDNKILHISNEGNMKNFLDAYILKTEKNLKTSCKAKPEINETPINYISLIFSAFKHYPGNNEIGKKHFQENIKTWKQVIRKAIETKEIKENIDADAIALCFANLGITIMTGLITGESIDNVLKTYRRQTLSLYDLIKS